jgi:hypothetical protein
VEKDTVIIFKPYPFKMGQKIYIDGGSRKGDWEVVGISDPKIKLRCPVSLKEFEWDQFCYFAEARGDEQWPHKD